MKRNLRQQIGEVRFLKIFLAFLLLVVWLTPPYLLNYTSANGICAPATNNASPIQPTHDAAESNAFRIFNSVHSAMRQWGSSVNHNGFAFIPAVVPRGTLLYHGSHANTTPTEPEWLAFEVEHSQIFSRPSLPNQHPESLSGEEKRSPGRGHGKKGGPSAKLMNTFIPDGKFPRVGAAHDDDDDDDEAGRSFIRGYSHTYMAKRDLKLLYIDGMAAAKTEMGTLDTQDLVLLGHDSVNLTRSLFERQRAEDLCKLVPRWGCDGVLRMEFGFEIIACDFQASFDLVNVVRQLIPSSYATIPVIYEPFYLFAASRAASQRYQGIGAGRVTLDFSGATSALFYPVNISSSRPERPDLVRIGSATPEERRAIKQRAGEEVVDAWKRKDAGRPAPVDWQGITDMIVSRYSDRIAALASGLLSPATLVQEIEAVVSLYIDAPPRDGDIDAPGAAARLGDDPAGQDPESMDRCVAHYILPALLSKPAWTASDSLIATAIGRVSRRLCTAFFASLDAVAAAGSSPEARAGLVATETARYKALQEQLKWSTWMRCGVCKADEMCFIAMWPVGYEQDHWTPVCKSVSDFDPLQTNHSYWIPTPWNMSRAI